MIIRKICSISLLLYVTIHLLSIIFYIPRIKLWFDGLKKQERFFREKKAKFALIVPARNESKIIKKLMISILNQTYDRNLFDIYLIVDDENDKSISISKSIINDIDISVCKNQNRKAEALDFCFKKILSSNKVYDDFIIIDADNLLTSNFLEEMNNALLSDADIIIPRKRIKNWETNDKSKRGFYTNCSASTYVGIDAMGNKGKCLRGDHLALCGQGMLISYKIIKSLNGYPFRTITEDYEISFESIKNGYKEFYYEYAEIYSEEPVKKSEYNKRRIRWIKGFAEFNKKYGKEIKKIIKKDKEKRKRTYFFRFGPVPVYFMFGSSFAFSIIFFVLFLTFNFNIIPLILSIICLFLIYFELLIYDIFILQEDKDINKMTKKEKIEFVIFYPFVAMEYLWVFFVAFLVKKDNMIWEPIERLDI